MYLFTPPTVPVPTGINHPLFGRMRLHVGVSLLKDEDGFYHQVNGPTAEQIDVAALTYLGGHVYWVSNEERADLITAGYGDWLITYQPTTPGYGEGGYGEGEYGGGPEGSGGATDVTGFGLGIYGSGPYGEG